MNLDISRHPCFDPKARHQFGANSSAGGAALQRASCNFCNRQYDCLNESRPGVTSAVLSPLQAR